MSEKLCIASPVVYLHRKAVMSLSPCPEGVAMFDKLVKLQGRKSSLRLTIVHMLWAACDHSTRGYVAWLQDNGALPRLNLYGANLSRANLYGANLYGASLYRANLSRANLEGANLYGANLSRANPYEANLEGANLEGANLCGANLHRANLYGANLYMANLAGASRFADDAAIPGWKRLENGTLARE